MGDFLNAADSSTSDFWWSCESSGDAEKEMEEKQDKNAEEDDEVDKDNLNSDELQYMHKLLEKIETLDTKMALLTDNCRLLLKPDEADEDGCFLDPLHLTDAVMLEEKNVYLEKINTFFEHETDAALSQLSEYNSWHESITKKRPRINRSLIKDKILRNILIEILIKIQRSQKTRSPVYDEFLKELRRY